MKSISYEVKLDIIGDERGSLVVVEELDAIPFELKRIFYMYGNGPEIRRGFHAHRESKQMLVCVSGSCKVLTEGTDGLKTVLLDSPDKGLYLEGLVWHEMFDYSDDGVLLVMADRPYDESDYVRKYQDFLVLIEGLK